MSETIARMAAATRAAPGVDGPTRLTSLNDFGSNPGALGAFVYTPPKLPPNAPLVVILHGCTQTAAGYDRASGWSQLADEQGFLLLYPEQQRGNNANGCFNWFEPNDTRRDAGEPLSIRQMIATVQSRYAIDPGRIFITGLSAGGAMTATMLATYPDVFAGGAVIAGLPHGTASGVAQAFDQMRGHRLPDESQLQALLRSASNHAGPWPRISIWHGSADATVSVENAAAILAQWRGVHGVAAAPTRVEKLGEISHRDWCGPDGQVLIEEYIIPGMAHGTPLKTTGDHAYGTAAPHMLDVGISSTLCIARFWGIAPADQQPSRATQAPASAAQKTLLGWPIPQRLHGQRIDPSANAASGQSDYVGDVINKALRAAGLIK